MAPILWFIRAPTVILPLLAAFFGLLAFLVSPRIPAQRRLFIDSWALTTLRVFLLWFLSVLVYIVIASALNVPGPMMNDPSGALIAELDLLLHLLLTAALASIIVFPKERAVAYLVVLTILELFADAIVREATIGMFEIEGTLTFLSASLVELGIIEAAQRIADDADEALSIEKHMEEDLALARAQFAADTRANNLVHDRILTALSGIASAREEMLPFIRRALSPSTRFQGESMSAGELLEALASLLGEGGDQCSLDSEQLDPGVAIPGTVAAALLGAVEEALNNIYLHAGCVETDLSSSARCACIIRSLGDQIFINVRDNGVGFDPTLVTDRHGIRHSIIARMHEVGGLASVSSSPGEGTEVHLEWAPPLPTKSIESQKVPGLLSRLVLRENPRLADGTHVDWESRVSGIAESRGARLIATAVVVCIGGVIGFELFQGSYSQAFPVLLGAFLQIGALILLMRSWPDRSVPSFAAWLAAAFVAFSNALVLFVIIPSQEWPGWQGWSTGTGTFLACLLVIRWRIRQAWLAVLSLIAACTARVLFFDHPLEIVFSFVLGHVVFFLIWLLIILIGDRAVRRISTHVRHEEEMRIAAASEAMLANRLEARMDQVVARSRPIFEAALEGRSDEELRTAARLLEAELRDEIRAPYFTGSEVVAAARRARERGVEVVLFDEGGGESLTDEIRHCLESKAIAALDSSSALSRVVIRLEPPRRRRVATILIGDQLEEVLASDRTN
ncbi:hypothetical protein [Schaalia cardiffensis]|uniref:hypothetical protein n=1 Tax=Schaalia cardiffensis TaxID=181487 RepID=UPI0023EFADAB|nr:hypothetical protein [Schaalia cardiffensis]